LAPFEDDCYFIERPQGIKNNKWDNEESKLGKKLLYKHLITAIMTFKSTL
jgi:hypothetical protein